MKTRYILYPGCITSKNDGDLHYIGARQLADLYGIDFSKCTIVRSSTNGFVDRKNDIHLHPKHNGNYDMLRNIYGIES